MSKCHHAQMRRAATPSDADGCQGVVREAGELCRTSQAIEEMVEAIWAEPGRRFDLRPERKHTH